MIIKIAAAGFVCVVLSLTVKKVSREFSLLVSFLSATFVLLFIFKDYADVLQSIMAFASKSGIRGDYIKLVLKVIGIGYVCEFTSSVAYDAGEKLIASYIEFSCKICIMAVSMPVFTELITAVTGLLP